MSIGTSKRIHLEIAVQRSIFSRLYPEGIRAAQSMRRFQISNAVLEISQLWVNMDRCLDTCSLVVYNFSP